jgi:hypothetical protein
MVLGGVLVVAGAATAWRAVPKVTLTNAGLLFAHGPLAPLAALAAAAAAALLVRLAARRMARVAGLLAAAALLALAAQTTAFRLEVGPERISLRGLLGLRAVAWSEVRRVDTPANGLLLEGRNGERVLVSTRSFDADLRAMLERAVARHVATAERPGGEAANPP